jgi:hypothetical protein
VIDIPGRMMQNRTKPNLAESLSGAFRQVLSTSCSFADLPLRA